jgi:hypothetical protein
MEEIETRKVEAPASQVPGCQPMHRWQTQFYDTFNNLHEIYVHTEVVAGHLLSKIVERALCFQNRKH